MSTEVAKRYVKAMSNSMNAKELDESYDSLKKIVPAFKDRKFIDILLSSSVDLKSREEFVLSLFEKPGKKLTNFIKLLSLHDRLQQIPSIVKELKNQISTQKNEYEGLLISNFKVTKDGIKDIETSLSKRFDAKIKLENEVTDYPGIKVEIESLGAEVSFSTNRLKAQISEHIFKTL